MTGRHLRLHHRYYFEHEAYDGDIYPHGEWSEDLDCEPDEYDREDGLGAVDLAVARLTGLGVTEPSGGPDFPGPHCWWGGRVTLSHYTGEMRETSAHPEGFSDAECRELWARLTGA
ncbi:hypothetical protein CcI49_32780 [Frankia sp. CcI49]|uniref:hypothetical protein n=1 Tax=Frankia sp. CcI49 TaxID=1745382 RepID=UPI0009774846|nr:hypothetical protein [Frankia sp. CcI49]ONH52909.1 hypothetical protein CcI49_32780 [Frankia sp. CcI49]